MSLSSTVPTQYWSTGVAASRAPASLVRRGRAIPAVVSEHAESAETAAKHKASFLAVIAQYSRPAARNPRPSEVVAKNEPRSYGSERGMRVGELLAQRF